MSPIERLVYKAWFVGLMLALAGLALAAPASAKSPAKSPPNILLFILDDVGIDQLAAFVHLLLFQGGGKQPKGITRARVTRAHRGLQIFVYAVSDGHARPGGTMAKRKG